MTHPRTLEWALFDFGDTLVREPFCTSPPPEIPDWVERILHVYDTDPITERWMLGQATHAEIAQVIAAGTPLDRAAVVGLMEAEFRDLDLNPGTWECGQALGRAGRAAIVTVNPDVFTTVIEPHYRLDQDYPVRVTSWEEGTVDKSALCRIALERLGDAHGLERAILIDNRRDNVEAFRAIGGAGYLFSTDAAFVRDLTKHPDLARLRAW